MSYWRLSSFYLFFFASVGVLAPYWSLYLKSLGFGTAEIGELMAVIMATKIVALNIWGWVADRSGQKVLVVLAVCFFTASQPGPLLHLLHHLS